MMVLGLDQAYWVERISSTLTAFHHHPEHKHSIKIKARPCVIDGEKYFVVNSQLADLNPNAYEFVLQFTSSNDLNMKQNINHVGSKSSWKEFDEFQYIGYDS